MCVCVCVCVCVCLSVCLSVCTFARARESSLQFSVNRKSAVALRFVRHCKPTSRGFFFLFLFFFLVFFLFVCLFEVDISSRTLIPLLRPSLRTLTSLFRPGSVHGGSAS